MKKTRGIIKRLVIALLLTIVSLSVGSSSSAKEQQENTALENVSFETAKALRLNKKETNESEQSKTVYYKFTAPEKKEYYFVGNQGEVVVFDEDRKKITEINVDYESSISLKKGETIYLKGKASHFKKFMLSELYQLSVFLEGDETFIYKGKPKQVKMKDQNNVEIPFKDVELTYNDKELKADDEGILSKITYSGVTELAIEYKGHKKKIVVYMLEEGENISFETAKELVENERLPSQYSNHYLNYVVFTASKKGVYYPVGGDLQIKMTKNAKDKPQLVTEKERDTGWELEENEQVYFIGSSLDFGGFMISTEKETIVVSGYAYDGKDKLLRNQGFQLEGEEVPASQVQTNEEGYFFVHLIRGKTYRLHGKEFDVTVTAMTREKTQLDQTIGKIDLGSKIANDKGKTELKSSAIYMKDEGEERQLEDGKLQVSEELNLQIGDVMVLPPSSENPEGKAIKVKNISQVDGKQIVETEEPQLYEVIDKVDGKAETLNLSKSGFIPADGIETSTFQRRGRGVESSVEITVPLKDIFKGKMEKVEGEMKIKIAGKVDIKKMHINFQNFDETEIEIDGSLTATVSSGIKLIDSDIEAEKLLGYIQMPTSIPGTSIYVPVKWKSSLSGEVTVSAQLESSIGLNLKVKNGKIKATPNLTKDFSYALAEATCEVKSGITGGIGYSVLTIETVESYLEVGFGAEIKATMKENSLKGSYEVFNYSEISYKLPALQRINSKWGSPEVVWSVKDTIEEKEVDLNKDYLNGLKVSDKQSDNPDLLSPQQSDGYSNLRTGNNFYIVEKNKKGEYRSYSYNSQKYSGINISRNIDSYSLGWYSGASYLPSIPIEMKPEFKKYYKNSTVHPWQGKTTNQIINWLNYWSTSKFFIVKSDDILFDVTTANLDEGEFTPSQDKTVSYYQLSLEKMKKKYGKKQYLSGLKISDNRNDHPDFLVPKGNNYNPQLNLYNNYHLVEKTKEGEYRYVGNHSLQLRNKALKWISRYHTISDLPIEMKPEYVEFYKNSPIHPWQGKSGNEIMNWLNYWSTSEFFIVQSDDILFDIATTNLDEGEFVPSQNKNIAYYQLSLEKMKKKYGKKQYLSGLKVSDNRNDYPDFLVPKGNSYNPQLNLYNNYHLVEKTKEGEYRYGGNQYLQLIKSNGVYKMQWPRESNYSQARSIEMKPEYAAFYENSPIHPWQGKTANELMNWLNYWSTSEFFIVKSDNILYDMRLIYQDEAEFKASPDSTVNYSVVSREKQEQKYNSKQYVNGLKVSDDRNDSPDFLVPKGNSYNPQLILYNNYHLVEKTKEGEYRYGGNQYLPLIKSNGIYTMQWPRENSYSQDRPIEMKPEYAAFYENSPIHPWQGKTANELMNWLNYWSTSEFFVMKSDNIGEDIALLNESAE